MPTKSPMSVVQSNIQTHLFWGQLEPIQPQQNVWFGTVPIMLVVRPFADEAPFDLNIISQSLHNHITTPSQPLHNPLTTPSQSSNISLTILSQRTHNPLAILPHNTLTILTKFPNNTASPSHSLTTTLTSHLTTLFYPPPPQNLSESTLPHNTLTIHLSILSRKIP